MVNDAKVAAFPPFSHGSSEMPSDLGTRFGSARLRQKAARRIYARPTGGFFPSLSRVFSTAMYGLTKRSFSDESHAPRVFGTLLVNRRAHETARVDVSDAKQGQSATYILWAEPMAKDLGNDARRAETATIHGQRRPTAAALPPATRHGRFQTRNRASSPSTSTRQPSASRPGSPTLA